MLLDNIALFLMIVEKGSLVAAGRESGLSSTTVSERLAALEAHYGVVLLNRTTRSISLTEEGRALVDGAKPLLEEVAGLDSRIRMGAHVLSGQIRLGAPQDLGRTIVSEAISSFQEKHPAISIDLMLSDGYVDIVGQGLDLAIRFGPAGDSSLRVRALPAKRRIVCAAPDYLDRCGVPENPEDLKRHTCLVMRFGQNIDNVWHFSNAAGKLSVRVGGGLVANDGALVRQWGLEGRGVMLKSEYDVRDDIKEGRLSELLAEYETVEAPLQILFPPGRTLPRRVRLAQIRTCPWSFMGWCSHKHLLRDRCQESTAKGRGRLVRTA